MKVYKDNLVRDIPDSQLQQYLDGGWKQSPSDKAKDVINLKPAARVRAAETKAEDNAIEELKGE